MRRYAIYYAPERGPLADFAASWLGWDAVHGAPMPHPDLPLPVEALTEAPRKYGFHATLKAPFRLVGGQNGLEDAVAALASRLQPVELEGLVPRWLDGFLALVPMGDTAALDALAADVVTTLDPYRAPLTEAELARRKPEALTAHQRELLARWGYPYVLDQFKFHMTLTGRLEPDVRDGVEAVLLPMLAPILPRPHVIDAICLFGEGEDGMFRQIARYPLDA